MPDFSNPTQVQLQDLENALLEKEPMVPVPADGRAEIVADNSGGLLETTGNIEIAGVVPANTFKAPDGRTLWLSVVRDSGDDSADSINLMLIKPPDVKNAGLPDREDFEVYRLASGKLGVNRYYLDVIGGLGCNAVEMAVTPVVVNGMQHMVRGSAPFNIFD